MAAGSGGVRRKGITVRSLLGASLLLPWLPGQAQEAAAASSKPPAAEFSAFAGAWLYQVRGSIYDAGQYITLDSDEGVKVNPQVQALLHYGFGGSFGQHWWVPQIYAGYVHLGGAGQVPISETANFGGIPILSGNTVVTSGINVTDYNFSLDWRWSFIDSRRWRVETGAEFKYLLGSATVNADTQVRLIGSLPIERVVSTDGFDIDQPVPLGQARISGEPLSWLHLEASGAFITFEGNHLWETRLGADFWLWGSVYLSAAWQIQDYKVNVDPYVLRARLGGPSLGITIARRPYMLRPAFGPGS
jgi:hypothetical protein